MLTKSMRQYVNRTQNNGYAKDTQNVYNSRLRSYAQQAIKDLALLAEKLPEDQQRQIFNRKNMGPLVSNIYRAKNRENQNIEDEEFRQRCHRILNLSYETLVEIGSRDNTWHLAPDVMKILVHAGLRESFDTFVGLKGIFIAAFNQPESLKQEA